jgi:hypothetical protein
MNNVPRLPPPGKRQDELLNGYAAGSVRNAEAEVVPLPETG